MNLTDLILYILTVVGITAGFTAVFFILFLSLGIEFPVYIAAGFFMGGMYAKTILDNM